MNQKSVNKSARSCIIKVLQAWRVAGANTAGCLLKEITGMTDRLEQEIARLNQIHDARSGRGQRWNCSLNGSLRESRKQSREMRRLQQHICPQPKRSFLPHCQKKKTPIIGLSENKRIPMKIMKKLPEPIAQGVSWFPPGRGLIADQCVKLK